MSIVNFFFWIMLILLGLLTGALVDSHNRSEKLALAELERIRRTGHRPTRSTMPLHRQYRTITRLDQASNNRCSTRFFTVGTVVGNDGENSADQAMGGESVTFDFSLPHGKGYDAIDETSKRAAMIDCPSCA